MQNVKTIPYNFHQGFIGSDKLEDTCRDILRTLSNIWDKAICKNN